MREILFRGKWLDGAWVHGDLSFNREGKPYIRYWPIGDNKTYQVEEVDPSTVGQYTGLKDKNGQKIFEGDVVRWDAREWGGEHCEEVKWDYDLLGLREKDWAEYCEVIGSIHDKPELLEGGPR